MNIRGELLSRSESVLIALAGFLIVYINLINVFYVIGYNVTSLNFFISVFPATKDLMIILLFLLCMLNLALNKKFKLKSYLARFYLVIGFYALILFIGLITSDAPFIYRILNFRLLLLHIVSFLAFLTLPLSQERLHWFTSILFKITFLISIFGLIEYFSPDFFWNTIIGLKKYAQNRLLGGTESDRNYSSDLIFILGRKVRRMMSFFAEPVTLGAYYTFMFSFLTFTSNQFKHGRLLWFLVLICGLLIISKLFIVSVLVVLGYKWIIRGPKMWPIFALTLGLYALSEFIFEVLGKAHGSFSHLLGFYSGINLLADHPFGFGLGMSGNRGFLNHNIAMGEFGGESGLGCILSQLGYPGFTFPLIIILLMNACKKKYLQTRSPAHMGIFVSLFTFMLNFYLSFASLGLSGNVMVFIFAGLYLNPSIFSENTNDTISEAS